jgi:capsular exopolysaccharide synthesis family protein
VERLLPGQARRVLLVVGAVPGEGASTVAARFAERLGEDPRLRALLVDADLRNADPRPVELVEPGSGFASVLAGLTGPDQGIRPTESPGLDVLPSEGVAADPYALCSTERLPAVLEALRERGDYVILDGAPVLVAPETALFARAADGVLLVVRAGRTKREVIQRALERLAQHEASVLGVVMNRQKYAIPEFIYRRL